MTVARFCRKEGVSTASFYRWRNRLADRQATAGRRDQTPAFQAVRVTRANAPVSIQLPSGVRVEVPAENLDAVRAVLGELLRQAATPDGRAFAGVSAGRGGASC